ncbi:MAG: hypothetical protein AAFM91_14525 [Pseudomonadota bacterium]
MKKILLSLVVFFAGASNASAYDFLISCDGCSFNDEKWAAQSTPTASNGAWIVYVMDASAETLTGFAVSKYSQYIDNWGLVEYSGASEIPIDAQTQADFDTALGYAQSLKAEVDGDAISIPASIAGSAYEVLFNPGLQAQISDHIAYNLSFFQFLGAEAGSVLNFLSELTGSTVSLQVVFADGSTMRFKVTGVTSTNLAIFTFEYIEGTANSPDGNSIPDSVAAAQIFVGIFESVNLGQDMTDFLYRTFGSYFGPTYYCTMEPGVGDEVIVRCSL